MTMTGERWSKAAGALWLGLTIMLAPAGAQQQKPADAPKSQGGGAVGVGSSWTPDNVKTTNTEGQTLDAAQMASVKKVDDYFGQISNLRGRFAQTTSDKKQSRGKFYISRPGKFRFEYAPPSQLVTLSDGKFLHVEDHDLKNVDRFDLDATPIWVLLRKDVNVSRDSVVFQLQEADDLLVIGLKSKGDLGGWVRLFFVKSPAFELKEWETSDAQGIITRVELSELDRTQVNDAKLFVSSGVGLPGVSTPSGN
jgi:outer membrane lipoprotein-sorting protein